MQNETLGCRVALAHSPIHEHLEIEPPDPSLSQHIQEVSRIREMHVNVRRPVHEQEVSVVEACHVRYRRRIVAHWVSSRCSHKSFRKHRV